jgi:hypothetical protein
VTAATHKANKVLIFIPIAPHFTHGSLPRLGRIEKRV